MKKICICCGLEKDITEFSFRKDTNKYRNQCKDCRKQQKAKYDKEYNTKNKERRKQYRKENEAKIKEHNKQYYEEHKEVLKKNTSEYYHNNKAKVLEKCKEYRENNKEKIKISQKKYRESNKVYLNEKSKQYYEEHKEVLNERRKNYRIENNLELRKLDYEYRLKNKHRYKYTCKNCGKSFTDFKLGRKFCSTECFNEYNQGSNNPNYNVNLTDEERAENRDTKEYKVWRKKIFEKYNYTCQCCGQQGGDIVAHHLDSFDKNKESRLDIENGIVLCKKHHKEFHHIYGYGNNTKEQYEQFINDKVSK